MHMKQDLARMGSTELLGMGTAMPWEGFWHAEWASPMVTGTSIQNKLLNKDGEFIVYWLALALTTIPKTRVTWIRSCNLCKFSVWETSSAVHTEFQKNQQGIQ